MEKRGIEGRKKGRKRRRVKEREVPDEQELWCAWKWRRSTGCQWDCACDASECTVTPWIWVEVEIEIEIEIEIEENGWGISNWMKGYGVSWSRENWVPHKYTFTLFSYAFQISLSLSLFSYHCPADIIYLFILFFS